MRSLDFARDDKEGVGMRYTGQVRESESQRVRESESQRVRESESQRVRELENQILNRLNLNQKKSPTAKAAGDFLNAFED